MTSNEILKADVLDILFDNRNKQYGAYVLRKTYNSRLGMALGMSLSLAVLLFFILPGTNSSRFYSDVDKGTVVIRSIEIPPEVKKIIPPPIKRIEEQIFRQRRFTQMVIVNKEIVDPPPEIRELETNLISDINRSGDIPTGIVPAINETIVSKPVEKAEANREEMLPSREPEFPGGQDAWMNFLRKNLNAPAGLEPGEKKTVSIRFFVSVDGAITDFEVVQSAGRVFDNEVIRVLKKMPKWKPAIQNGQPIARAFTQPVTFIGMEE
jgi:protein TonB